MGTVKIDFRGLAIAAAVVLGLVAGFLTTFLFWIGAANIYGSFGLDRVWGNGGLALALFMLGLYPIWVLVFVMLGVIKRAAIRASSALLFVFVFLCLIPLPSIFILFMWWKSCLGLPACAGP